MAFDKVAFGAMLVCLCCCAPQTHRVYIERTDNLVRGAQRSADIVELMEPPTGAYRVIAGLVAVDDAQDVAAARSFLCENPDCELWSELRETAANLGGNALIFRARKLIPCVAPATAATIVNSNGAVSSAVGPSERLCVELKADALIVQYKIDCEKDQACRSGRKDAVEFGAQRGALPLIP